MGHGFAHYVRDLALALRGRELPFELLYLIARDAPPFLRELPHRESAVPFLHPLEPWRLPREIESASLFHSPTFASLAKYPCPYVQTVHDLNHLHFGNFVHKLYYRKLLLPSLRGAKRVIAVSRSGARELGAWLLAHGIERKIDLAPNAITPPAAPDDSALANWGLKEFFFCASNPKAHKNVDLLLRSHERARLRGDCLPLVLNFEGHFQEGLFRTGHVSPEKLSALFAGARAFFFPSLYEGFGRAPLEAGLFGTPSAVSDIEVHREVLTGVKEAEFLDPRDELAWEDAFLRFSREAPARVSPESRGWIQREYSVARLGDEMEKVYREALGLP
jgi:alpha-1,3-rhamnosyl/mannosyltransferase